VEPQSKREFAPVIDETAFEQLLAAAYVMQEHNSRLKASKPGVSSTSAVSTPSPVGARPTPVVSEEPILSAKTCHECGLALDDSQFFCENCGAPVERTQKTTQKNWASLWDMHSAEAAEAALEKPPFAASEAAEPDVAADEEIDLFPAELKAIVGSLPETEVDQEPEAPASAQNSHAITRVQAYAAVNEPSHAAAEHSSAWTSAAKARAWLDSLKAQQPSGDWFKEEWTIHRGAIYIALATAVLLAVIFQSSARTTADPGQPRELTGFERVLISLGLAEAPPAPALAVPGNPQTKVWVDVHTALYYCPGADLYGKTPNGRYATQLEAQRDNFQPSTLKACD
jgi:hypothetical protein